MEDGGDAAGHGGHDPHPVSGAAPPAAVFILHVLNEGLGGGVVVNDGHFVTLWEERTPGVRRKDTLGYFGAPSPPEQCFLKGGPGDDSRQCKAILCIVFFFDPDHIQEKDSVLCLVTYFSLSLFGPMDCSPSGSSVQWGFSRQED